MNKSKLFMFVSIAILAVTIVVSGATYAWYTWSTGTEDETKIVTNLGTATVYYDAGSNIESVSLKPVPSKEEGIVKGELYEGCNNEKYLKAIGESRTTGTDFIMNFSDNYRK